MYKYLIICLLFVGCAKDSSDGTVVTNTVYPVSSQSDIEQVIDVENQYRVSIGQYPLTKGLTCTIYTVPNTTTQIVGATGLVNMGGFTFTGQFNQPNVAASQGLNILPAQLQSYYVSYFMVKCTGQLVMTTSDHVVFDLTSDDGSNLYIDGSLILNNDGTHSAVTKFSTPKMLKRGIHSFELDYFEGPAGNEALILNANGELVPSEMFYH